MSQPTRQKRYLIASLSLIYIICGIYIGCDSGSKPKKQTQTTADAKPAAGSTQQGKTEEEKKAEAEAAQKKKEAEEEARKKKAEDEKKKKAKLSNDEEEDDEPSSKGSSQKSPTGGSLSLQFSGSNKAAFCKADKDDLFAMVKKLSNMSTSDMKDLAKTQVGKIFTLDQMKSIKGFASNLSKSQISSLQSQVCGKSNNNDDGEEEEEEEEDDEDKNKDKDDN